MWKCVVLCNTFPTIPNLLKLIQKFNNDIKNKKTMHTFLNQPFSHDFEGNLGKIARGNQPCDSILFHVLYNFVLFQSNVIGWWSNSTWYDVTCDVLLLESILRIHPTQVFHSSSFFNFSLSQKLEKVIFFWKLFSWFKPIIFFLSSPIFFWTGKIVHTVFVDRNVWGGWASFIVSLLMLGALAALVEQVSNTFHLKWWNQIRGIHTLRNSLKLLKNGFYSWKVLFSWYFGIILMILLLTVWIHSILKLFDCINNIPWLKTSGIQNLVGHPAWLCHFTS